jgi:DNA-binding NarL/FixJ family response regulator
MLLATLFDITERKQTEEQLMRAIQEVMNDTSWFSQRVIEQLAHVRSGGLGVVPDIDLSKREREVLEGLAKGLNNDAIATELGIATQTVRNYISTVYDKLGVHSRSEAIVWARERGIV